MFCAPCPDKKGVTAKDSTGSVRHTLYLSNILHPQKHLYESMSHTQKLLKVVSPDFHFDMFGRRKTAWERQIFSVGNNIIADSPRKLFKFT